MKRRFCIYVSKIYKMARHKPLNKLISLLFYFDCIKEYNEKEAHHEKHCISQAFKKT